MWADHAGGQVGAALEAWRDGLVDLTGADPLIDCGPGAPGTVEITGPSPKSIVRALQEGAGCGFLSAGADPAEHPLNTELTEEQLGSRLHQLYLRSSREFLDRGVTDLYLAIGVLHWSDDVGHSYASPILLLPVEITPDGPRLTAGHDDPMVNPALALRLRRLGVQLPASDVLAGLDVTVLWARLDVAISERRDWHADETVVLGRFAVHRVAMYLDLLANEQRILAHPIVRALILGAGAPGGELVTARDVDRVSPPEHVPLVLDADAEQRACVVNAVAGRSFVIDGPPGTGKSQTIANMIGCLLHAGKRVLFVSAKAVALDTVAGRLADAGLGGYLLELHSRQTGRQDVAAALAAALDAEPSPATGMDPIDRRAVRERREQLDAYAEAMNRVREPLGHSLHEVLGWSAQLLDVPAAPVPHTRPAELSPAVVERVRHAAEEFGRTRRDTYLWRDVVDRDPLDGRLHLAQVALGILAAAAAAHAPLADAFDLTGPADATILAALADHAAHRPAKAGDEWLTVPSLEPVQRAIADLTRYLAALRFGGVAWSDLPSSTDLTDLPDLTELTPPGIDLGDLTAAAADGLARRFADDADRLERHQQSLDRVTARLGLANVVTFPDSARVVAIADLIGREHKPVPEWFSSAGLAEAHAAARALRRAVDRVAVAEAQARLHFTEGVLNEPIDELADRFATMHRGMRKIFRPYREDKKAAAGIALPSVKPAQAVANLEDAAAWKQAADELAVAEQVHAAALGRHYRGLETDFDGIQQALSTVDDVLEVTPPDALQAVIVHMCAPRPNSALLRIVREADQEFERWRSTLRAAPARAARPELGDGPVQDAITWLRAHADPMLKAAELIRAYNGPTGRDLTLTQAIEIAQQRQAAVEAEAAIWATAATHAAVLGSAYRGTKTNDVALAEVVEWTARARRMRTGSDVALTDEQARALADSRPTAELSRAVAGWQDARQRIVDAFTPERGARIAESFDGYDEAAAALREFLDDSDGQRQWFAHHDARQVLADQDLAAAADFCVAEEIVPERMWPVIERALFRGWADAVIRDDPGLQPVTAVDRDQLVEEFRLLDQELTTAARADVINAVESRRPAGTATGGPELIRREGNKSAGLLAVRDLLAQAGGTAQALKPCFLTSPPAASRLLPPEIEFDVVILDEASQMAPADAVNCLYRGAALITVGDDRQLPPTSFYDRPDDAVIDHPSMVELARTAFATLELTTHYRSRHEALIAFADQAYYDGRLTAFPRADPDDPDLGVALLHTDGVFHRGTTEDNPIEAGRVAERVLHHYATRPGQTLGVIAFSAAQARAIEDAVGEAGVAGDRADGFFVKTVEAVQGDERDVIILSVGFGFDDQHKISTNFGSLSRPKGWRRLNVATTRARRRIEVVSSIRSADVPDVGNVRHLKAYLDFAERGTAVLGRAGRTGTAPLEDSVAATIRSWGFEVREHVGAVGYRIDLAVLHPESSSYAVGIECDGRMYHSASSARDRDRLRDRALRDRGWTLHRIWSTAWYHDRTAEENRLLAAIERAVGDRP
jgi:very-short-patch-repair endonuclease